MKKVSILWFIVSGLFFLGAIVSLFGVKTTFGAGLSVVFGFVFLVFAFVNMDKKK